MNEALLKYPRMTLKSSPNAISLLESVAGQLHSGLPNGQTTEPFGQDHLLANPSPLLETKKETTMNATSGQFSSISLKSEHLQQYLGSKLQARLGTDGSILYKQTWRTKTTPQQWSYSQLVASAHRKKEIVCGTSLTNWPTPMHTDGSKACNRYREKHQNGLGAIASTVQGTWATPTTRDYKCTGDLENYIFGSPTGRVRTDSVPTQAFLIADSSTAGTEKPARSPLNPRFSLWLMGYPIAWAYCAERVMRLSRKSRQK